MHLQAFIDTDIRVPTGTDGVQCRAARRPDGAGAAGRPHSQGAGGQEEGGAGGGGEGVSVLFRIPVDKLTPSSNGGWPSTGGLRLLRPGVSPSGRTGGRWW